MKFSNCKLLLIVGLLVSTSGYAAERKGFQAVGLSKWSNASAANCAAAVKESGAKEFEFAFMPFFNSSDPFRNVSTILSVPNATKVETIFLSWRNEPGITLTKLSERAKQVNSHINAVRNKAAKLILVPMLEDNWNQEQWLAAVKVIAAQLDSGSQVYFRRSKIAPEQTPPSSIAAKLRNGSNYTFTSTRLETHRMDHGGVAQVISNDGGFVYQDSTILGKYETSSSLPGAWGTPRTLSSWNSGAATTPKVSILWRPVYNLFPRKVPNSAGAKLISYQQPTNTLDKRSDSESAPAFDAFEKEVLKAFLK